MSQQPLVRALQRPAEHVAGPEQAVDAVVVGNDAACQPRVDVAAQGADVLEMAADLREIAVVPPVRGGEHRAGFAVVRRDVDHDPDDVAPLLGGAKGQYDCVSEFISQDWTEDLKKITVPVLAMNGDGDQVVPHDSSGPRAVKLVQNGTLKTYPGFPHGMLTTHADVLNPDLLAFIQS